MKIIKESDIRIKKRKKGAVKGDSGKLLIIGGSEDYAGCLALAGIAALRTGADWVTVAAPEKAGWAVHKYSPDLVVKKFRCTHFTLKHAEAVIRLSRDFDALLIGSGIGLESAPFVRKVIKKANKPVVIDADGIKAVRLQDLKNAMLTPHKGEYRTLLKNSGISEEHLNESINGNVILLKGKTDRIISGKSEAINRTGNEVMAKAGTGDVLAGIAAGILAQGHSLFDSACWAAYINGISGDRLKKKKLSSFIASDMHNEIKRIIQKRGR